MSYAILHAHDTYGSIGDSILYIKDYVKKAKELGIKNLAITNHGSLATFVEFYDTCVNNDIKPIIGCEFYYVPDITVKDKKEKRSHLILLAKNEAGLKNIIKLHNTASEQGFYYKPRIDFDMLKEYHEGLICLTACVGGHIPRLILKDEIDLAKQEINRFKALFGPDFYLEIQPGNFDDQKKVNHWLCLLSEELYVPIVATNDVHYLNKDEWRIHDAHVKDSRKQSLSDSPSYPDCIYYVMSRAELKEHLLNAIDLENKEAIAEKAIDQTLTIADKVNVTLSSEELMPCYDPTINEAKRLTELCYNRLRSIENRLTNPALYESRLEQELDTIHYLRFDGYFLIVKDIVDFCDANNIARGPGRGSAVGSLVSYLLDISKVDPIKYGLLFERFLSKDRKGFPDIDLDVLPERRSEIYRHIIERYGENHCCFVSTFNKRKARAAIKTAARILNKPVDLADRIAKALPYVIYEDDEKQNNPSIEEIIEKNIVVRKLSEEHKDIFSLAIKLQNYPSAAGIHPAGIVISPVDITDRYPLIRAKDKELHATSLDLSNVERLSGVKFDLLALSNLTTIAAVERQIGLQINYEAPGFFEDDAVWSIIGSEHTTGLFQISSNIYKYRMPKLKPHSIPELAACLALVRGPCISSHADRKYINILQGKEAPDPICKEYWNVTKNTCGIIIYQEQVLLICQSIGLLKEESYRLLKACSKKKTDKIKEYEKMFYSCAKQKGIEEEKIDRIWREILNSAKYAFNISHAVAYAFLCYASAWLKVHYANQYMCELLNKIYTKPDTEIINNIARECIQLKLSFLPVDINKSDWNFTLDEFDKIRLGFIAIKGLGVKAYEAIQSAQKPFVNFRDFLNKIPGRQCNKKCIMLLIMADAFKQVENKDSLTLLTEYVKDIRKEEPVTEIKLGKDLIDVSETHDEIEKKIFGINFPREGEQAQ